MLADDPQATLATCPVVALLARRAIFTNALALSLLTILTGRVCIFARLLVLFAALITALRLLTLLALLIGAVLQLAKRLVG